MSKNKRTLLASLGIGTVVIVLNFWHIMTQWIQNPNGRSFTWIAHYYADFFLYVSQIAQGTRGNWIMSSAMYTNEFVPDTWVYWPNVLIGKIGSISPFSPFELYTIALFIFVVTLLTVVYIVMKELFPNKPHVHILAFLLYATASNFPNILKLFTTGEFSQMFEMWFSPTPALNRLGGVPHQTLQTICILCTLLISSRLSAKHLSRIQFVGMTVLFACICFITATLTPIQMLIVCASIIGTMIVQNPSRSSGISLCIGVMSAAMGAFLVNRAFDASILYAAAKTWEASQTVKATSIDLLLAMGPIILMIPFGIRTFLSHRSPLRIVFFIYGICSFILFATPIPHWLGTSPTRWIHPASFIIFAGLAGEGFFVLSASILRAFQTVKGLRSVTHLIPSVLLLLYLLATIPSLIAQVYVRSSKETASILFSSVNHVPLSSLSILQTLAALPNTGVVLTDPALPYDAMVPIRTGKRSFTGHPVHTLFPQVKEERRRQFFMGSMDEQTAKQFLSDHMIGYILTSTQAAKRLLLYPFIKPSHYNEDITIYEVTH